MTFVNPAILWGLAAVSIPILIHIFNLKRTRKIEFSTLMFLKEIHETKQKRIKLKQLLILLSRIAFIILAVMAFAGPFSKGFLGSVTDKSPASVLIFLDDSFSMNGRTTSGSDFDAAKSKSLELLNTLDNNDEVFFIPVSKMNDPGHLAPYKELNNVRDSVTAAKISDSRKDISAILYKAKSILSNTKYPLKEVYFITDGQSSMFTGSILADEKLFDDKTRFSIILTSGRASNNISIDSIDIKTKIFSPGRTVKLSAIINNHNNFNIANKSIVFTSGSYRDEKVMDLPASTTSIVDFSFTPEKPGYADGKIELIGAEVAEDEFTNDNTRNFAVYIPSNLKVLIVSPQAGDAAYLNLAISSSETLISDSSGRSVDFYKLKSSAGFTGENLNDYNCVALISKTSFTQDEATKLKDYIESGGGAVIYPGKNIDVNNYNEILNKTLNIPYLPQFTNAPAIFEKADLTHPLFEGVFKSKSNDIKMESPSITSFISPQQGENSESLIKLNNGQNFLVQYNIGKGKILMYAVPPDRTCSDFPESGIFSPITIRSIAYVSKLPSPKEAICGDEYYFNPVETGSGNDSLSINVNGKITGKLFAGENYASVFNLEKYTNSAGICMISSKNTPDFEFPVNTNKEESLPAKWTAKEVAGFFENQSKLTAEVIESSKPLEASIRNSRTGQMLWEYFMIGALLFIGIEFWLAKSILKVKKS